MFSQISVGTVSVPKKWKNIYILANDESHKEFYLHLFSALSERIPSQVLRTGDFLAKKIFESNQKKILAAVLIGREKPCR